MLRHLHRTVNLFDTAKSACSSVFSPPVEVSRAARIRYGLIYYETYDPRSLDPALSH